MTCNCSDESNESNATDCNETCPTTCATQTMVPTSCGCNTGCGCTSSVPGTAVPYYNAAEGCEESHKRVCIQSQYVTGVSISNTFNMPACNQTAVLVIPGLQLINIGVYLWNTVYGYLKVVSFDFASSTVVVENECLLGNAPPGTTVPSCTVFTIVDNPNLAINPCENELVQSGSLMVCSGGVMHPLDGAEIGQIPVLTDPANNIVSFQNIDIPTRICEELTIDLTLIAGNAGPYVLTVTDTATFAPGNVLQLNGRTDRFTVVLVTAPTTFTATVDPLPGNEVIPATTPVCHIGCCEQVNLDLGDDITNITNNFNSYVADPCSWDLTDRFILETFEDSDFTANGTLAAAAFIETAALDRTIVNDKCKVMLVGIDLYYRGQLSCNFVTTNLVTHIEPKFGYSVGAIGAAPAPVLLVKYPYYTEYHADTSYDAYWLTWHENVLVPFGSEIKISSKLKLTNSAGDGTISYDNTIIGHKVFRINI